MILCTFCNKKYSNKYSLKTHQSGKSCLKNKTIFVEPIVYECDNCEHSFSTKFNLKIHKPKCPLRHNIILKKFDIVSAENIILKNKVENLTSVVNNYEQQIKDLNALLSKLSDKTTIINNTNNDNRKINIKIHIQNYIKASPECMSVENLQKYMPKMNIGHILSEGNGYGKFIVQYIIQHIRMVTTDASRGIVFYKDESGKVIKDIGLSAFFKKFGIAFAPHVKYLVDTLLNSLNLDLSEPNNIEQYRDYTRHITQMNQCSNGDKSDFIPSALKVVSAGTDHSNLIF